MDRHELIQEYVKKFPDSPVKTLLSDEEKKFFDNRLPGIRCPRCNREEITRVIRDGSPKGLCRKCLNEFDLNPGETPEEITKGEKEKEKQNSGGDSSGENNPVLPPKTAKRKIMHTFDEDAEKLKSLLKEGKTSREICIEMEISSGTLYEWKKKLGLLQFSKGDGASGKGTPPEGFLELYKQGKNDAEIAKVLKVSDGTPWYWRKKLGLPAHNDPVAPRKNSPQEPKSGITSDPEKNGMTTRLELDRTPELESRISELMEELGRLKQVTEKQADIEKTLRSELAKKDKEAAVLFLEQVSNLKRIEELESHSHDGTTSRELRASIMVSDFTGYYDPRRKLISEMVRDSIYAGAKNHSTVDMKVYDAPEKSIIIIEIRRAKK